MIVIGADSVKVPVAVPGASAGTRRRARSDRRCARPDRAQRRRASDGDDVVPAVDRQLAGDQEGAGVVAVLDDLEEIARLLRKKRLRSPVVEHEQVDPGELAQEPAIAAVAASERQGREQTRHAVVKDGQDPPGRPCGRARRRASSCRSRMAAVEDRDGAAGQAHVDLLADQSVRHGVGKPAASTW